MQRTSRRVIVALLLALVGGLMPFARTALAAPVEFVVTSNADDGAGTLREALTRANSEPIANDVTIRFNIAGSSEIAVGATTGQALPPITRGNIAIVGTNAGAGGARIVLRTVLVVSGLQINNATGVTISNLVLQGFGGNEPDQAAIVLNGADNNRIENVYLGTNAAGSAADEATANYSGVLVVGDSDNNIISNSVISGNRFAGVFFERGSAPGDILNEGNVIRASRIGVDASGANAVPNGLGNEIGGGGIVISDVTVGTIIGGDADADGNIISGNSDPEGAGISVFGSPGSVTNPPPTQIKRNIIGLNASGSAAVPNSTGILAGALRGPVTISNNTISGNSLSGILVQNPNDAPVVIDNNVIGLGRGAPPPRLGNGQNGIRVEASNTAGVPVTMRGNTIAGNTGDGIALVGSVNGTVITGNLIGTDSGGTAGLGNNAGVLLACDTGVSGTRSPSGTQLGGATAAERNVISGNNLSGVVIQGASGNTLRGNYIGTTPSGTAKLANGANASGNIDGVTIATVTGSICAGTGSSNNTVENNVISGNGSQGGTELTGFGVVVRGASSSGNILRGNTIGVGADGTTVVDNAAGGVLLESATNTLIENNTIAANGTRPSPSPTLGPGIRLRVVGGAVPSGSVIRNNTIGGVGRGNGGPGIDLVGVAATTTISTTIGPANTIVGNGTGGTSVIPLAGVRVGQRVNGVRFTRNVVWGNNASGAQRNLLLAGNPRANDRIVPPTISGAGLGVAGDTLVGTALRSDGTTPCTTGACTVEVFTSDESGVPNAKRFLVASGTFGDGGVPGRWSVPLTGRAQRFVFATVTDEATNMSSELSNAVDAGEAAVSDPQPLLSPAVQSPQPGVPGGTVVFTHFLTNTGNAPGQFIVSATPSTSGFGASVEPTSAFELAPQQSSQVTITVSVPAGVLAGDYAVQVQAQVVGDATRVSQQTDVVTVGAQRGFSVTPPATTEGPVAPPSSALHTYTVANTGNVTESFTITPAVIEGEPDTRVVLDAVSSELVLGPGQSRTVGFQVFVSPREGRSVVTTSVTLSLGGNDAPPAQTVTQTTLVTLRPVPELGDESLSGSTLPNQPISYTLTLSNLSPVASGTVTVSVAPSNTPGWSAALVPPLTDVPFAAGSVQTFTVVVTPTNLVGGSNVRVTVRADASGGALDRVIIDTTVEGVNSFDFGPPQLSSTPQVVATGEAITYTHFLTNTGNVTETFTFSSAVVAGDPDVALTLPDVVEVPPFASRPVAVQVAVGANASQSFATTVVTATAQSGLPEPTERAVQQITTLRQVAVPQWTPPSATGTTLPNQPISYTLVLSNSGLIDGTFAVTASAVPSNSWEFAVSPAPFVGEVIVADAAQPFTVVVTPSSVLSDTAFVITLTATTQGGPSAQAVVTTVAGQVPDFAFDGDAAQTSPASQLVTFTNFLTNTSNGRDTFSFTSNGPTGVLPGVGVPPPLTLAPGASAPVSVTFTIAPGAPVGSYSRVITATSTASPTLQQTIANTVTVLGVAAPQIDAQPPQTALPGDVVTFTHTITNVGNTGGTISVGGPATLPTGVAAINIASAPSPLALGAFPATGRVTVTITLDAAAPAGRIGVPITATVGAASASVIDLINIGQQAGVEVGLGEPPTQSGRPLQTLTYSHVVTNTGNGDDTFTVTLDAALPGWQPSGPISVALDAGLSTTLQVSLTVPPGTPVGVTNTLTVTLVSTNDANARDSAEVTAGVLSGPSVTIIPTEQTGIGRAGDEVEYTLVVSNSGNITDSYTLAASSVPSWTTNISPTSVGPLGPNTALNVTLRVAIPPDAPETALARTTVVATSGLSATVSATANVTTTAGQVAGVLLAPDRASAGAPGQVVSYTHFLTNTGLATDSFALSVASSLGWNVDVVPATVSDLAPGGSAVVTVRVTVPRNAAASRQTPPVFGAHIATLRATSTNDPRVSATVTDETTVGQQLRLDFSPRRSRVVQPGDVVVYRHTVRNLGNGPDQFTFAVSSSRGWPVTLSATQSPQVAPSGIAGYAASSTFEVVVTVRVPADAVPGALDTATITATSQLNPEVSDTVIDTSIVPIVRFIREGPRQILLPLIVRGSVPGIEPGTATPAPPASGTTTPAPSITVPPTVTTTTTATTAVPPTVTSTTATTAVPPTVTTTTTATTAVPPTVTSTTTTTASPVPSLPPGARATPVPTPGANEP
jgi:parallel beta-helix repeat protein